MHPLVRPTHHASIAMVNRPCSLRFAYNPQTLIATPPQDWAGLRPGKMTGMLRALGLSRDLKQLFEHS